MPTFETPAIASPCSKVDAKTVLETASSVASVHLQGHTARMPRMHCECTATAAALRP